MKNDLKSSEALKAYARKVMYEKNATNFSLIRMFDEIIDNTSSIEIATKLQPNCNNLQQRQGEWIQTSEMLPDEYGCYLVMWRSLTEGFPDRLFYEICEYEPEEDEWEKIEQAGEAGAEIVAWMPLPERYEPKEKENG